MSDRENTSPYLSRPRRTLEAAMLDQAKARGQEIIKGWPLATTYINIVQDRNGLVRLEGYADLPGAALGAYATEGYVLSLAICPHTVTPAVLRDIGALIDSALPITEGEC